MTNRSVAQMNGVTARAATPYDVAESRGGPDGADERWFSGSQEGRPRKQAMQDTEKSMTPVTGIENNMNEAAVEAPGPAGVPWEISSRSLPEHRPGWNGGGNNSTTDTGPGEI